MDHLACVTPEEFESDPHAAADSCRWRFLAQGDSWFAPHPAGHDNHANLLAEMTFPQRHLAVNCAGKGAALSRLVDLASDPDFARLLTAPDAPSWDGILLSVGGSDLILAMQTPAHDAQGAEIGLPQRLLRRQTEWGPPSAGVARYFSEAGWQTFSHYLSVNLRHLLTLREQGASVGKPVFLHCYAAPMPRPAGDWLYPVLKAYAIPAADWLAVSRLLLSRLGQLFKQLAADPLQYPGLHVFDSAHVPLAQAVPGASGSSGDWQNEVHLNHSGCMKLAGAWAEQIQGVLAGKRK
ncbi:MAG: hypothetical protein JOY60_11390 [Burkholderiaceae bacterium]|nr:hypothetical protein [Burkholderiaceae bacterium]